MKKSIFQINQNEARFIKDNNLNVSTKSKTFNNLQNIFLVLKRYDKLFTIRKNFCYLLFIELNLSVII